MPPLTNTYGRNFLTCEFSHVVLLVALRRPASFPALRYRKALAGFCFDDCTVCRCECDPAFEHVDKFVVRVGLDRLIRRTRFVEARLESTIPRPEQSHVGNRT